MWSHSSGLFRCRACVKLLTFAKATGTCGPEGETHPCEFLFIRKDLSAGKFTIDPTEGTDVSWETKGTTLGGNEQGYVIYQVGDSPYNAKLIFSNPAIGEGQNTCEVEITKESIPLTQNQVKYPPLGPVTCHAGSGVVADLRR